LARISNGSATRVSAGWQAKAARLSPGLPALMQAGHPTERGIDSTVRSPAAGSTPAGSLEDVAASGAGESREFVRVGHHQVARLMRAAGLVGASRRKAAGSPGLTRMPGARPGRAQLRRRRSGSPAKRRGCPERTGTPFRLAGWTAKPWDCLAVPLQRQESDVPVGPLRRARIREVATVAREVFRILLHQALEEGLLTTR
jgi:hypothetical protein